MDSLSVSLNGKSFQALLNGLNQLAFSNADESRYEALQRKIYGGVELDPSEIRNEMNTFESIIRKAGQDNWTVDNLREFLINRNFDSEATEIFCKFWSKESFKIHQNLFQNSTFNNSLKSINWRVDMKAMSKQSSDINEPIASFEINLSNKKTANFDLNRNEISQMIDKLNEIQQNYDNLINTTPK